MTSPNPPQTPPPSGGPFPPGSLPPVSFPPGVFATGNVPPGAFPPGAPHHGAFPHGAYPPPGMMPPGFYPPAPRSGGGFARAIFITLAVTVLGLSLTTNFWLLIMLGLFSGGGAEDTVNRQVLVEGDAKKIVAVIPVKGIIYDEMVEDLRVVLDNVQKDKNVKAIVVEIDSPGGTVTASDEIHAKLLKLKSDRGVPLVVSMQGLAASGGYYIACAGDKIVAQPHTLTGSIGVRLGGLNIAKLLKAYGVEDNTMTSTEAKFKLSGSPFREETDESRAYMQTMLDAQHAMFKQLVATSRKLDPKGASAVANGKVFTGTEALQLKLVDSLGYLNDAVSVAEGLAGISGAQVERVERQVGFLEALSGGSSPGTVQVKIGEASVGVDKRAIEHLVSPRPMFLLGASD